MADYSSKNPPSMQKAYDSEMLKSIYTELLSMQDEDKKKKQLEEEKRKREDQAALLAQERQKDEDPISRSLASATNTVRRGGWAQTRIFPQMRNTSAKPRFANLTPLSRPVAYAFQSGWQKIRSGLTPK